MGASMKAILGLSTSPVGVRFLTTNGAVEGAKMLDKYRYCQALKLARHGQSEKFRNYGYKVRNVGLI